MTQTLNLFEQLLVRARRYQKLGQRRQALALLYRLAGFPDLPGELAGEVHARLGEIHLRRRLYRKARRHLQTALKHQPGSARYHFLLGLASHHDPAGDPARAARYYRRSLRLEPRQLRCLGEAGLLALARGRTDEGLDLLHRAVELAPGDAEAVSRLARGLGQIGRPDEALQVVRSALFGVPRGSRLWQLWIDLQLAKMRREQETTAAYRQVEEGPVILPFVRVVSEKRDQKQSMREDDPASLPGPHLVRLRIRRGWRRAP